MKFKENQAIYLQIAEYICEQIMRKELLDGDKIPSIRDLAISIAVNPNTVVRAYGYLEEQKIIYKQRGIGYFLTPAASAKALILRKNIFLRQELPRLISTMKLLQLDFKNLSELAEVCNENQ